MPAERGGLPLSFPFEVCRLRHSPRAADRGIPWPMAVRRFVWRVCYESLAKRVPTSDWAFMNYGYSPATVGAGTPPLRSSDEPDRLCIQLYLHAIDNFDLRDRDVLEVGSGRGGGASYISRYLQPRSMTGMDFSQESVDLCNRHRLSPGLAFVCGDAQSMPFPASSFDAVVNIESSHCYESMDAFLAEVCRVLRPGGRFFFADLRNTDGVNTLREQFDASGLTLEKETDITTNVLTALRLDNARKLELIDALIPRVFHWPFRVFAGIAGTRNYAGLEHGKLQYLSARLAKSSLAGA
ncbi:MAG TPA: class I SAM-dependent methyltransferase [Propionibacteriaceae bacterium]|nr:class I SAM-dependent methyltransferase [Propionibacteriaceae bacterium]